MKLCFDRDSMNSIRPVWRLETGRSGIGETSRGARGEAAGPATVSIIIFIPFAGAGGQRPES